MDQPTPTSPKHQQELDKANELYAYVQRLVFGQMSVADLFAAKGLSRQDRLAVLLGHGAAMVAINAAQARQANREANRSAAQRLIVPAGVTLNGRH